MLDAKPNLASYARVSYFRELHGDLAGAERAMRLAVDAGGAAPENVAYVQTLLGQARVHARPASAPRRMPYRLALYRFPAYAPATAGLARVDAARGGSGPAIARLRGVVDRLPLPEYVIALGEAELAAGRPGARRARDLALVRAEQRLLAANGVNTDTEIALFEADHGSPARAVTLARRAWANGTERALGRRARLGAHAQRAGRARGSCGRAARCGSARATRCSSTTRAWRRKAAGDSG